MISATVTTAHTTLLISAAGTKYHAVLGSWTFLLTEHPHTTDASGNGMAAVQHGTRRDYPNSTLGCSILPQLMRARQISMELPQLQDCGKGKLLSKPNLTLWC